MDTLTDPMHRHHKHCDNLFADAEAAAAKGDWARCRAQFDHFHGEIEAHFHTEEEVLFPAFETATGMAGGPTRMMRLEHAQMRELFAQMADALGHQDGDTFSGAAGTLLILMQQHNMKEENILYPMIDRGLAGQAATLAPVVRERLDAACPTLP